MLLLLFHGFLGEEGLDEAGLQTGYRWVIDPLDGMSILEEFSYKARPDAEGFEEGHVFDLGGGVTIEALHLPGHTRGHSGLIINNVFFLSDIDLTGFGPYYGDAWSDLDQFDDSLRRASTAGRRHGHRRS